MECPNCKEADLYIYKGVQKQCKIPTTKKGKPSKRNIRVQEFSTEMDYLECRNYGKIKNPCNSRFEYEIDEEGFIKITDDLSNVL